MINRQIGILDNYFYWNVKKVIFLRDSAVVMGKP